MEARIMVRMDADKKEILDQLVKVAKNKGTKKER